MRTVGHRQQAPLSYSASAELLVAGARCNEEFQRFPGGRAGCVPKGVYRFATHEQANRHQLDCLARHMARVAGKSI